MTFELDESQMASFDQAMVEVYRWEGHEYTNHPADKGGPTKHGIILKVLQDWRYAKLGTPKDSTTANDVQNLGVPEANEIYRALYWNPLKLGSIKSQAIATAIMSMGVNCGIRAAAMSAQRAFGIVGGVGIVVDGVIGDLTIRAINSINEEMFLLFFFKDCQRRYIDICVKNPSQVVFLRGWMNRVNAILDGLVDA